LGGHVGRRRGGGTAGHEELGAGFSLRGRRPGSARHRATTRRRRLVVLVAAVDVGIWEAAWGENVGVVPGAEARGCAPAGVRAAPGGHAVWGSQA
ncbi:hypothetical protein ACFYZ0_41735, partial [Streptomyces sp. NPDC001708]